MPSLRAWITTALGLLAGAAQLPGHPLSFNSTITYSASQPVGAAESVANWTGAAFDAANIGGSGVNGDGGANNGSTNDASTYVANNQPVQGQTITTGGNANGYDVASFTVRMTGYTGNTATGSNIGGWNLNFTNGPLVVSVGKISGTTRTALSNQFFTAGGTGNPGSGGTANGPGTYLTFTLPFAVHLDPNTTYGFDLWVGNGNSNYFEWLGTGSDPYSGGTAYTRSGNTLTPLTGDRVFMVNMTAASAAYAPFVHPGALHTQADFDRMVAKVAANTQPWKADYDILVNSPWAQTWWPAYDIDYINRGGSASNNYTRSQQDAQAIYELALRWKLTGDTAYADHAVQIANVWSGLLGVTGDTNQSLAAGICGYLFATGGEILSTYPGWAAAEKQAYKDMMMRVFYPSNLDFLWRHHDTPFTKGGNTHYRLNWDTDNMASMAAIGILCDNRAVYEQAVAFFKYGPGNSRVERAAWYVHPDGMGQTEEIGRDQGHNLGGWYAMSVMCQLAWNQGDDLYGYDNNRVLRAFEMNAKYNLGYDVLRAFHRNTDLTYTEGISGAERGKFVSTYEQIYNHYANVKGIDAPYSKVVMNLIRPEPRPDPGIHPSQVDWLGLGSLTFARDPIATSAAPSGLVANWSKNQVILTWWGSAAATSYQIRRAPSPGGSYTTLGTAGTLDLNFTDTTVVNRAAYAYIVTAVTPTGTLDSAPLLVNQALVTRYTFEGNTNDVTGTRNAVAQGGTSAPGYAAGFGGGQAISLNGSDQYVQLPVGSGNYQDITISAWVYWNGGNAWQRVFDFGTEIEKYMMLTVKDGAGKLNFTMTTSRGTDGTLTLVGPTMPTSTWTHVAVTLNGDTATMYVNGLPVAATTAPMVDPLFGQPFCYLGKSMWNADPLLNGRIDDFRIYNYALSGSEVYNAWGQSSNQPPVFSSDPMTGVAATEDVAYTQTLAGSATDPNGGTLTYSKVTGPSWLAIASGGALSGTPANSDVGVNTFVVRVTDSVGATDDATLRITVNNTNDAPVWSAGPITKHDVTRDQPYASASLSGDATDADAGSILTFSKVSGPAWLVVAADGTLSGTPAVGDVGVNAFTVRVTDDAGASSDVTLNITVQPFQLRAQYAFEGTANDTVGSLNGTAAGSPVYGSGRLGQALTFDGVDDVVTLPADVANHRDITVAAFVYWNGGGNNQRVFDFGNGTGQYLFLTPNSGSGLRFAIKNGGGEQQLNSASALPTGRWVHVAVTISGDTGTLYVDGAAVATNTAMTINPDDFRPAINFLGDSQWSADPLLNGKLDDVRIYNYALTAADVFDIANPLPEVPSGVTAAGLQGKISLTWTPAQAAQSYTIKRSLTSGGPYSIIASGITSAGYTDTGLGNGVTYYYVVSATNAKGESANSAEFAGTPSDLLAHLKFNEATGATTAADSSGNGYNATLLNSPSFASGQFGNAVTLAGASSQYAALPAGIVSAVSDFTISAWVNPATFATWARVFDFGTGTSAYMFLSTQYTSTSPNGAKPRFAIRTASVNEQFINSSIALTANAWNHIAITLSGNTATMYVNGSAAGTNTGVTLQPSSLGPTTQNYIGRSQWSADPYFNGAIDDFRIYSRALTASEIVAIAGTPATLSPPQGLAASPGANQIALSWNTVLGATSYTVKRSSTSGGPYVTVASGVTGTTCTDTGLTDGVTYYYLVSAVNNSGESDPSSELGAKSGVVITDGFTELFTGSGDGNDTASTTYTFTPENNVNGYTVFRTTAAAFPTDPTGGTTLTLSDDTSATVTLTSSKQALLYGVAYSTLYVGSNGYVSFGSGDTEYSESLANHFNKPRVSALFDDLNPASGGTVSWKQLSDRVAVIWQSVPEFGATSTNSFQIELFFDGKVRITLLSIAATDGLIGLSRGTGTPSGFVESNFSAYPSIPTAPTGLSAIGSDGGVALSWSAVSGTAYYRIKRSASSGSGYVTIATTNSASYADTAVADGATYYYRVSAVNIAGESADSTEVSATTYTTLQRWRLGYFGMIDNEDNAADAADPDGDGWTNSQEFISGTDPTNRASFLRITQLQASGGDWIVTFPTVTGKTYRMECSNTLETGSWSTVLTNGVPQTSIAGTGGNVSRTDTDGALQPRRFYRVVVMQ